YSPDDGREMGLQGMINHMLALCDFPTGEALTDEIDKLKDKEPKSLARLISAAENFPEEYAKVVAKIKEMNEGSYVPVLGITGTGGSGKSSLVDELVNRFLNSFDTKTIAVISVDPSKRKTGGALLGDRIRMNAINNDRVFVHSLATRQCNLALSKHVQKAIDIIRAAAFDLVVIETSGIGQSDTEIIDHSDLCLYVMTPEYGAATQLEKIDMLDFADFIALNKSDKSGALDAVRDVKKQYRRNHKLWEDSITDEELPVYATVASQFNDPGVNLLFKTIMDKFVKEKGADLKSGYEITEAMSQKTYIIPPERIRYLSEISYTIRNYNQWVDEQADTAQKLYGIKQSLEAVDEVESAEIGNEALKKQLEVLYLDVENNLDSKNKKSLQQWEQKVQCYKDDAFIYKVRDKDIKIETQTESLSASRIPKVTTPRYKAWGDILRWNLQENVPG
ncbi:MAG: hypothetical protein GY757_12720, partial [bacterium]|nr:hypothetical protein [bacterium]